MTHEAGKKNNILKMKRVSAKANKSKTSIYAGVKDGTFPAPVKLGERSVGWIESEIDDWIETRPRALVAKEGKR